jgi:hypothetical protein
MAPGKKNQSLKFRYPYLHRCYAGVAVAGFLIWVVGGVVAGVRPWVIALRGGLFLIVLLAVSRILIKSWASFEEMKPMSQKPRKK